MSETGNVPSDALAEVLRLGAGFGESDRPQVLHALAPLTQHLAQWDPAAVDVEISVKHRAGKEQQLTLRASLPGFPPLVAKAEDRELERAIAAAKRELLRQIEDEKGRRRPKDSRLLRKKTP